MIVGTRRASCPQLCYVQIIVDYMGELGTERSDETRKEIDVVHVAFHSEAPTAAPTRPTRMPTPWPTWHPTVTPTQTPTLMPTLSKPAQGFAAGFPDSTLEPTWTPSDTPSGQPTRSPSEVPTTDPYRPILIISRAPTQPRKPCDSSAPPIFGGSGNCTAELQHGQDCRYSCKVGYTVSGLTSCFNGELKAVSCLALPCSLQNPPRNGLLGTCKSSLASGQACEPTCNDGFKVSGESTCLAGTLKAATCDRFTQACHRPNAPAGCFRGRSCEECCNATPDPRCWQDSTGLTFSACCSSCRNEPPLNGQLGSECPSVLASLSTCRPTCDEGYELTGLTSCVHGRLITATCSRIDMCAVSLFKVRAPAIGLPEPSFTATIQLPESPMHAIPTVTIVPTTSNPLNFVQSSHLVYRTSGELIKPSMSIVTQIFVDGVLCRARTNVLTAGCKEGIYVKKGQKCARLPSESVCAKSALQIHADRINSKASSYLLGGSLRVLPHPGEMSGCMAHLQVVDRRADVDSSALSRLVTSRLSLQELGKYALRLRCPDTATPCAFLNFREFVIRCAPTHHLVAGGCQPRLSTCPRAFFFDGGTCKTVPVLLVRLLLVSSETLTIDVAKTRNSTVTNTSLILRLSSGQFEVQWNSSCTASWASCRASGTLAPSSTNSTAAITIQLNASGHYDDSAELGRQGTYVTFHSSVVGATQLPFPGQLLSSRLRMRVISRPYVLRDDVTLTTIDSGGLWEKSEDLVLPREGHVLSVDWGRSVRLQVCDCA